MKLHKDKYAFLTLIHKIHDRSRIREDILEKDYYVTLLLKELSEKQEQLPAYFKGGTALYKALKSIRRFSEDIDLTVDIGGCSSVWNWHPGVTAPFPEPHAMIWKTTAKEASPPYTTTRRLPQ